MVQFLSINFFSWISSIFVGFFKSSRFFVSLCIATFQNCVLLHADIFMFKCTEFAGPANILYASLYSALCTITLPVNMISCGCYRTVPSLAPAVWRGGQWICRDVGGSGCDVVWRSITAFAWRDWGNTWKASGEICCHRGFRSGLRNSGFFGLGPCTSVRPLREN